MRFIILHKTNDAWEAGATPGPELIARVGSLIGELARAKVFLAGEGLRATSQGARVEVKSGVRTVRRGPFHGENELPAGFAIFRAESLDEAIAWASRQAAALDDVRTGDVQIDVRPVTEPWDIGMGAKPAGVSTRRWMALRKATPATEAGAPAAAEQRAALDALTDETRRSGALLAAETMLPSARGRRYKNSSEGARFTDGPFAESKELIAGYVVVRADSLDDASRWATRYIAAVEAGEVDVLELEEPEAAPAGQPTT
jgi:hypothetical protein